MLVQVLAQLPTHSFGVHRISLSADPLHNPLQEPVRVRLNLSWKSQATPLAYSTSHLHTSSLSLSL